MEGRGNEKENLSEIWECSSFVFKENSQLWRCQSSMTVERFSLVNINNLLKFIKTLEINVLQISEWIFCASHKLSSFPFPSLLFVFPSWESQEKILEDTWFIHALTFLFFFGTMSSDVNVYQEGSRDSLAHYFPVHCTINVWRDSWETFLSFFFLLLTLEHEQKSVKWNRQSVGATTLKETRISFDAFTHT